jgi:hypothetical protein
LGFVINNISGLICYLFLDFEDSGLHSFSKMLSSFILYGTNYISPLPSLSLCFFFFFRDHLLRTFFPNSIILNILMKINDLNFLPSIV